MRGDPARRICGALCSRRTIRRPIGPAGSTHARRQLVARIDLAEFILADPVRMIRGGSEEMMSKRLFATVSFAGLLAGLTTIGANAQALSGKVSSAEEGLMEGVLVSAKKEGSTVTTTVVSNAKGEFSFPADRMEPGRYNVTIRAAGYVLAGPKQIDVAAGAPASAESKLAGRKNIQAQLPRAEGQSKGGPGYSSSRQA